VAVYTHVTSCHYSNGNGWDRTAVCSVCVEQESTNSGQGAISYWLPVGRKPGKYIRARFTTWNLPAYNCELYSIEIIWVAIKAPPCGCELRMSLGRPCSSSLFNPHPHTSWTPHINVSSIRLIVYNFEDCSRSRGHNKKINWMKTEFSRRMWCDKGIHTRPKCLWSNKQFSELVLMHFCGVLLLDVNTIATATHNDRQ
jgi:hypothetical protein